MAAESPSIQEYIGIAADTLEDGITPLLNVYVPEFVPNTNCCLKKKVQVKGSIKDPFTGSVTCCNITKTNNVVATYLGGSNMFIPCVVIGERVRVIRIGGMEQLYWLPLGRDPGLRRHERVRWFIMDQPTAVSGGSYPDVMDTNTYFVEFNSNKGQKEFHVHTGISDSEKHAYDIHILPEQSKVIIKDDIGNYIQLLSEEHWWRCENTDNSFIEANKENITISCKDTITLKAGKKIIESAGESHHEDAPAIERQGGSTITDNAPSITVTGGQKLDASAPATTITGSDTLTESGATINISGSSGDVSVGATTLETHVHIHPHGPAITLPGIP